MMEIKKLKTVIIDVNIYRKNFYEKLTIIVERKYKKYND